MFSTRQNSGGSCHRASVVLIIIISQAVLSGCKSRAPQGRCGLPDLCSPTVMNDPFPNDQNVPPKGVDMAHYGYSRPQWRVLTSRDQFCCLVSEQACAATWEQSPSSALQEVPTPAPAAQQPTAPALPPAPVLPPAPATTSQQPPAPASQQTPALVLYTESVRPIVKPAEAYTPFALGGY
jgi:hypothetical protein